MTKPSRSSSSNSPSQERDWDQKDVLIQYDVKRCPMVHRGIRIFTDRKSKGFAVLQVDPSTGVKSHPMVGPSTMCSDFKQLLEEAVVDDDIHDVNLMVKGRIIPAHKFILATKSAKFHHILIDKSEVPDVDDDAVTTVTLDNVDYDDVMKYVEELYSGYNVDDAVVFGTKKSHKADHSQSNHDNHNINHTSTVHDESESYSALLKSLESISLPDLDDFSTLTANDTQNMLNHSAPSPKKNKKKAEKKGSEKQNKNNKKDLRNQTKSTFKGLKFKRTNCPELQDVTIESEDGVEFLCHKCVLIARLDYFRSMLACGWLETSKEMRTLSMPIHSSVFQVVLDYIYTDEAKIIKSSQNIEFIGNVLVIADQLLIGRLREICETAMAKLISQRNAMELLEFSCVYNANQLQDSCLEFICNNLGSLLEGGYLGLLNKDTLDLLSKAYKEAIPRMPWRLIPPQFDHVYALTPEPSSSPSKRRRSSGRKRSVKSESEPEVDPNVMAQDDGTERKFSESGNDVVFETVDIGEETEKHDNGFREDDEVDSLEAQETTEQVDIVPIEEQSDKGQWYRKKSDTSENQRPPKTSMSKPQKSPITAKEIPLSKPQVQTTPPRCPWGGMTATSPPSSGLREIMQQQLRTSPTTKAVKSSTVSRSDGKGKQSQKQRKKTLLAQEKENALGSPEKDETPIKNTNPPINPWALPDKKPTPVRSLRELIDLEEKSQRALSSSSVNVSPSKVNAKTSERTKPTSKPLKMSWGLRHLEQTEVEDDVEPPTSPRNAWQTVGTSSPSNSVSFADILNLQERENTNLKRKKPLNLIQLEDRAIQELLDHYGGRDNACEMITVERVPTASAAPVWNRKRTETPIQTHGRF